MNDNRCVCCGEQIPEGTQVCPTCARKGIEVHKETTEEKVERVLNDWIAPLGILAFIVVLYFLLIARN